MSLPKCRVKITLKCNKQCSYCINKSVEYRKHWTTVESCSQVDFSKYRSVIISGGEPTIYPTLMVGCASEIRSKTTVPVYLQTNGYGLTKALIQSIDHYIDGIGYSVHSIKEFRHLHSRLEDISRIKPIRLYVEDKMWDKEDLFFKELLQRNFSFRIWHDGEFDSLEQIYVLKQEFV